MKVDEIVFELLGKEVESIPTKIESLKERQRPQPDVKTFEKQWNPNTHDVFDKALRPDKMIKKDVAGVETDAIEKVTRIALALQKLIVKRAASFLFGREVVINTSTNDLNEQEQLAFDSLKKILSTNKEKSLNKEIARELFRCTEVAELWYPIESEKANRYGFESDLKIRNQIYSPLKGYSLFPLFDDTGDMIAFSIEYKMKEAGKDIKFFETFTSDQRIIWRQNGSEWVEVSNVENTIGKIPIVYGFQEEVEWADVQNLIDRLEKLLSNFGDTNDYHGSPKIFVEGELLGFSKKGDSGGILQGDVGTKASYLSWDHAPESVRLEIENQLRMIYSITQTPDISFDSVKAIGAVSGVALKLMFMDAHLKVEDKKEIFDEFLTRRYNIIKAYIGVMNNGLKKAADSLDLEPEITPYMIQDEQALVEMLVSATGQKQILSRKSAIKILNWADDVDSELTDIDDEELDSQPI